MAYSIRAKLAKHHDEVAVLRASHTYSNGDFSTDTFLCPDLLYTVHVLYSFICKPLISCEQMINMP
jgi:hypothetical protein